MSTATHDMILCRGGPYDGYTVAVSGDVDAVAVRSGNSVALYVRDFAGAWRFDKRSPAELGRRYSVLEIPTQAEFEASRSFGMSSRSSSMAGFAAELRAMGRAENQHIAQLIRDMQDLGASTAQILNSIAKMQAATAKLKAEAIMLMWESVLRRRKEWEKNKIAYTLPVSR